MSIRVACPGCQKQFKVRETMLGHKAKCPACQNRFTITEPETPKAPSAELLSVEDDPLGLGDLGDQFAAPLEPLQPLPSQSAPATPTHAEPVKRRKRTRSDARTETVAAASLIGAIACVASVFPVSLWLLFFGGLFLSGFRSLGMIVVFSLLFAVGIATLLLLVAFPLTFWTAAQGSSHERETWGFAGVVMWLIGCGLLWSFHKAGQAVEAQDFNNNLRQVAMALEMYDLTHRQLTPPFSKDENGEPLLSWRVHLLPFLGEEALYRQFHLDEPWDSPHNKTLISRIPDVYGSRRADGNTRFVVPVGPRTAFPPDGEVILSEIKLGTILVVAFAEQKGVIWTKPEDVTLDESSIAAALGLVDGDVLECVLWDEKEGPKYSPKDLGGVLSVHKYRFSEELVAQKLERAVFEDPSPGGDLASKSGSDGEAEEGKATAEPPPPTKPPAGEIKRMESFTALSLRDRMKSMEKEVLKSTIRERGRGQGVIRELEHKYTDENLEVMHQREIQVTRLAGERYEFVKDQVQFNQTAPSRYEGSLTGDSAGAWVSEGLAVEATGQWLLYHPNGILHVKGTYKEGKRHGRFVVFDGKGIRRWEGRYRMGWLMEGANSTGETEPSAEALASIQTSPEPAAGEVPAPEAAVEPNADLVAEPSVESVAAPDPWRIFTSRDGKHETEARLIGFLDNQVQLAKRDGSQVTLKIELLSEEDQHFIRSTFPPPSSDAKQPGLDEIAAAESTLRSLMLAEAIGDRDQVEALILPGQAGEIEPKQKLDPATVPAVENFINRLEFRPLKVGESIEVAGKAGLKITAEHVNSRRIMFVFDPAKLLSSGVPAGSSKLVTFTVMKTDAGWRVDYAAIKQASSTN